MVLDRSPRVISQTRPALEQQVESLRGSLEYTIADASQIGTDDPTLLKNITKTLKNLALDFGDASLKLTEWLSAHGHTEEAASIRRQRHQLVYRETREVMHVLNSRLADVNLETISTIGPGSDISESSQGNAQSELRQKRAENLFWIEEHSEPLPQRDNPLVTNPPENYIEKLVDVHGPVFTPSCTDVPSTLPLAALGAAFNSQATQSIPLSVRPKVYTPVVQPPTDEPRFSAAAKTFDPKRYTKSLPQSETLERQKTVNFTSPNSVLNQKQPPAQPGHGHQRMRMDLQVLHNMKQDLLKGMPSKFNGEPQNFAAWKFDLQKRIDDCEADSRDTINIIEANTTGRPQEMVRRFKAAHLSDPDSTLQDIWTNLERRFATTERIAESLKQQISSFGIVRENDINKIEEFLDLCKIIYNNMSNCRELYVFNLKEGMQVVLGKLPTSFQNKWRSRFIKHEKMTGDSPDFGIFIDFLEDHLLVVSHPQFSQPNKVSTSRNAKAYAIHAEFEQEDIPNVKLSQSNVARAGQNKSTNQHFCQYHQIKGHSIDQCKIFSKLPFNERKKFAYEKKLCFVCLDEHYSNKCPNKNSISCKLCRLPHLTLMHNDRLASKNQISRITTNDITPDAFQPKVSDADVTNSRNACTRFCGSNQVHKICSKTLPVEVRVKGSDQIYNCLCLVDEQSDTSFCDPAFIDIFSLSVNSVEYSLDNMHGKRIVCGSIVPNIMIRGVNCKYWYELPDMFTHPNIPDTRGEVATPEIIAAHAHIKKFAPKFSKPDPEEMVMILVGANAGDLMQSRSIGSHPPYVHVTPLGYSLVGNSCINDHQNEQLSVRSHRMTTDLLDCSERHLNSTIMFPTRKTVRNPESPFLSRPDDNMLGWSQEDTKFIRIMEEGISVNKRGNLQLPLPLKEDIQLPNNKTPVFFRTKNTLERLKRTPVRLRSALSVFQEYLDMGHVTPLENDPVCKGVKYYIPIFPVYDDLKLKTRLVFDSSATFNGSSLNQALMQGPDTNNGLFGVLLRFRLREVGVVGDIEKMFHSFYVDPQHTDHLRFFWFQGNDPSNDVTEYKALVHIFGNKPSPAIANFALRYTTLHCDSNIAEAVCDFVSNHFYVDDALYSTDSTTDAIEVLSEVRRLLGNFNIRLHKISSSHEEVLKAFPQSELSKHVKDKNIMEKAVNKTLGISWCIKEDSLSISPHLQERPFTKRGILSVVNAVYDPHGFVSPIVLSGKLLQRKVLPPKGKDCLRIESLGWDDPLPEGILNEWNRWRYSLKDIQDISIPRCIKPRAFGETVTAELHGFSDASCDAIGFVIYIRLINNQNQVAVSILYANSKVSPQGANTIPRMELNGALDLARALTRVKNELNMPISSSYLYTDSKIVMGYLRNTSRRFSRYISYRIDEILLAAPIEMWNYIPGPQNIGDVASRPHTVKSLLKTNWFRGPGFLHSTAEKPVWLEQSESLELPETKCLKIEVTQLSPKDILTSSICRKETRWLKACKVTAYVIKFIHLLKGCSSLGTCLTCSLNLQNASKYLIGEAQISYFGNEIHSLRANNAVPTSSKILSLSPYLDENGIIKVGGRLRNSKFPGDVKHPILLPNKHLVTDMILKHHHHLVRHQGRYLTSAAIRQSGFHVLRGSSAVKRLIKDCIVCRKIRGEFRHQRMADLPEARLEETPPFTNVGLDLFGPYLVHDGVATRRQKATKKVWVLLITCLVSRGLHVEVLPYLDTNSLQLGLRRFYAIRGTCKTIKSDRGSNIIGAKNQMINYNKIRSDAENHGVTWEVIPPGASSWGGVWERKVGSIKKVLDATLLLCGKQDLSRDEFSTYIQECASIVNNTPLCDTSSSPDDPAPISPASLLTLRDEPNPSPLDQFSPADILSYGKLRWRRIMYLSQQFWIRWRQQYLQSLHQRSKWHHQNKDISVGDVVLMKGPTKRNMWPMGRVTEAIRSKDGLVRAVKIRLPSTMGKPSRVLERSVRDTVLLVSASISP